MGSTQIRTMTSTTLFANAAVFFCAALFNFGAEIPLGFTTLQFDDPIWQAGTGETVIGLLLLGAGLTKGRRLAWVAVVMSVLGIVFGLSSDRVQGAARSLHVVMIAFAAATIWLLVSDRSHRRPGTGRAPSAEPER
jgi:hypothetical protein